jgi:hypothetical protein
MKLNNLKLIICNGNYINDDAISNAINYIYRLNSNKNLPIYCYGIPNMSYENIVANYEYVRTLKDREISEQKLFHIVLSFPTSVPTLSYYKLADSLARLFSPKYQICYSCHTDTNNLHYHYIISATSYLRNGTALCTDSLMQYLHHATSIFQSYGYTLELEVKDNV